VLYDGIKEFKKVTDMRYQKVELPGKYIEISKIVLGTDCFGTSVSKETSFDMLDRFVADGGNCIDTARVYAQWLPGGDGASEKLVGDWLKARKNRNDIIICTKGGHPPLDNMAISRLSKECITSDLEDSLRALGTETVDIYLLHRDDVNRPVAEIMETLHQLVTQGKIRAIGCSNWRIDRIKEANKYSIANGITPFAISQIQWSLASSTPYAHDDPTIVCMNNTEYKGYLEQEMPVMAFSSQAKGFFAKAIRDGLENINQKAFARFLSEENLLRLERLRKYATDNQLTPSAVALGYITCNKLPGIAVVGCKTLDQLKDTLTAQDVAFSEDTADWLFG